jgi:hypothetical protein
MTEALDPVGQRRNKIQLRHKSGSAIQFPAFLFS